MSSNYYRQVKDYPDLEYRNSEESALFLAKLVNSMYQIEDNYDFPISLLLYWGFSWEADEDEFFVGKRELTTAGDIPKPIQTGFELLARLKEDRLSVLRCCDKPPYDARSRSVVEIWLSNLPTGDSLQRCGTGVGRGSDTY